MKAKLVPLLALLLWAGQTQAAPWMDPNLTSELNSTSEDGFINVIVILSEQVDLNRTIAETERRGGDMSARHYAVIRSAQVLAKSTQKAFLPLFEEAQQSGEVAHWRSFWIQNAIACSASPAFVADLAKRQDVKALYWDAPIELIAPVGDLIPAAARTDSVENGVMLTGAPELWAMGIDGRGTLACDQDTGADGTHPAFANRWRGLQPGVTPAEAWFDPISNQQFPTDSGIHGTHTMGTILGDDGASNQIGMAPGAQWIGAKTIDVPGGNIFSDAVAAFEWAADPDGDPSTMDDVPDVINNSWGLTTSGYGSCLDDFNAAIDTAEAAGAVVIFAAGNEGRSGLRSPSNRISSETNTFAIGALNQNGSSLASYSSQGPSDCDNETIKPELSAVGDSVRSSVPGGGYGYLSGTSMAAPTVSGAVLLLRQDFPDASPEEVKTAMAFSAIDLGDGGDDNQFGMGALDVVAAYQWLADYMVSPDARLSIGGLYSCDDDIEIGLTDTDIEGPSIEVLVTSGAESDGEYATLFLGEREGKYEGVIHTSGEAAVPGDGLLSLNDGDVIVVHYLDENNGAGGLNIEKTATAFSDCMAPIFDGLLEAVAGDNQVDLSWAEGSDAQSITYQIYRSETSGGYDLNAPLASISSTSYLDETALNGSTWFYQVRALDAAGNLSGSSTELSASPVGPDRLFRDDFDDEDLESRWTVINEGRCKSTWTLESCERADVCSGLAAVAVKEGCLPGAKMDETLMSPGLDLSNHMGIELRFSHDFDDELRLSGDVDYSFDGSSWTNIAHYSGNNESGAVAIELDELAGHSQVFFRFRYVQSGLLSDTWIIDNVEIVGWPMP